jgi:alpha-N-arabinofuranosidase
MAQSAEHDMNVTAQVTVSIHKKSVISTIDKRLYGSFIEHMGRAVYSGIYEPAHTTADRHGFRQDVMELVNTLQIPVVRYPGGNFVSAYQWEDGIGPQNQRPTRLDLAWHSSESNQVGLHEFAYWADQVGAEMMLAVNLGSRGLTEARNLLEYVNHDQGSYWADLRRKHGQEKPWGVKTWCLGNEMDGPWQIGQKTAADYGRVARDTAKAMRAFDANLELVVCGSSSPDMPTYPEWERVVLEETYDVIDYISLHMYFRNDDHNTARFLAQSLRMEQYIDTVAATIAFVKAKKRSSKQVYISFDEWNVWYHSNEQDRQILAGKEGWPQAPAILEDVYNAEDALLVACLLNSFMRKSHIVKITCLAQLVNVIAPIMTEPGGPAWRQTIYYPLMLAARYGQGQALHLMVDSPDYPIDGIGTVPYVDVSAVYNADEGCVNVFIINRHETEFMEFHADFQAFPALSVIQHQVMDAHDVQLTNTKSDPDRVKPVHGESISVVQQHLNVNLAPLSYHFIQLKE